MNNDVKVCFDEIEKTINKIEELLSGLSDETNNVINNMIDDKDAWSTKYQKIFDRHLTTETKKFLDSVVNNCKKYNDYIKKSMQGYKKIDTYR